MNNVLRRLHVDPDAEMSLALQIRQQLVWLLATRQVAAGEQLPSVRALARHLGVNLNTVRAVYKRLEADALVSTRRGVGTTVLPFSPQQLAESVASVRSHAIGILIPDFASTFYQPVLEGIDDTAQENPVTLLIGNARNDPLKARIAIDQLLARGVDGLIIAGLTEPFGDGREAAGLLPPVVEIDNPTAEGHVILLDSEGASYQATNHLLEHGHEQIGLITCPLEWPNVHICYLGFQRALAEAGLEFDPSLMVTASTFSIEAGLEATRRLLDVPQPPAAIFAVADILAVGALQAIAERGLRVPEDIAITGYNDIPLAAAVSPPLTTAAAPARQLGVEAMKLLNRLTAGEQLEPQRLLLATELIVRQSCGCHPGGIPGG